MPFDDNDHDAVANRRLDTYHFQKWTKATFYFVVLRPGSVTTCLRTILDFTAVMTSVRNWKYFNTVFRRDGGFLQPN